MRLGDVSNTPTPKMRGAGLEPPTDKELLKSIYIIVLAALLIPPFLGGFVTSVAGFFHFPGFFHGLIDIIGVYVAVVVSAGLLCVPRLHRIVVGLTKNHPNPGRTLFWLNLTIWVGISVYSIGGVYISDLSMERLGYREYGVAEHLQSQMAGVPVALIATFPIYYLFFDKIGLYLAPRGIVPLASSIRTKVLILGIVSPLLIDTLLLGYFYNRTGYFSLETLAIWAILLAAASIGAILAWLSLKQGIQPLSDYTSRYKDFESGAAPVELVPVSLDEFGILTANLHTLEQKRIRLMADLRDQGEYSNTLLESMATVVVVLNSEGGIDYINPAFEGLSGRQLADVEGKDWVSTFLPETARPRSRQIFENALDGIPTRGNLNDILRDNGEIVNIEWNDNPILDEDGKVAWVIATGVDVTSQIAARKNLVVSEQRLSEAERIARLGNWEASASGDLVFSKGALAILGESDEDSEWTLDRFLSLIDSEDLDKTKQGMTDHINPNRWICRMNLPNGNAITVRLETSITESPDGQQSSIFGILQDITQSEIIEKKLRQSQKIEALGNMTGGVAHDFNNLLAIILGNLEMLDDEIEDAEHLDLIERSISATLRGADLTKKMLSFARQAQLKPSVVSINDVVRDSQQWIGRTLPSNIQVETSLLGGLWNAEVDVASTESAFLNLLLNARDAMPDGGKLTIETANIRIDEDYLESRDEDMEVGRYVMLAISDTGHGIDPETLKSVFLPFFTTKAPGKGSGLGLPMIEGFMKQSGGSVRVYSEMEKGTTFKLFFRAFDDNLQAITDDQTKPIKKVTENVHLLLAEDEEDVKIILVSALQKAGYQVTAVATGDDAFRAFKQQDNFDVLITDIVMPGELQGTDLSRKIREMRPDFPVVFMSGYASEATVHGNGLRPDDIRLMKPVRKKDMIAAIEKALEGTV